MRPRRGREASFDRSLARPHGDVVARPEASVGGHECKIAVEAMGDQHAVEWIAIIPVERARSFCVRPADRDLGKARRTGGGARRSLERELGVNLIDTFNVYSGGGSEELIGEAMGHKRKPGMLIAFAAVELLFNQQNKWAFVDKPLEPLIAAMRPDRPHSRSGDGVSEGSIEGRRNGRHWQASDRRNQDDRHADFRHRRQGLWCRASAWTS